MEKDNIHIEIEELVDWIKVKDRKATRFLALTEVGVKEIRFLINHYLQSLTAEEKQDLIQYTVINTEATRCNFYLRKNGTVEGLKAIIDHFSPI
ncbi:MAG: hypothetical protein IC227_06270 [Enterococcus lacertideformus]|uniref:Uncharacterized protein n=1 Tax=Enterococcus lacertideformus TaxID=2771493 RepID=A0A931FBV3_9ENTE|nr:hypothetical protein [Enterococcus lacertideformus]